MEQTKNKMYLISKHKFSIDVLRLQDDGGWLSNVLDFYHGKHAEKYDQWWKNYEEENSEFLEWIQLGQENERQLQELENNIIHEYF